MLKCNYVTQRRWWCKFVRVLGFASLIKSKTKMDNGEEQEEKGIATRLDKSARRIICQGTQYSLCRQLDYLRAVLICCVNCTDE